MLHGAGALGRGGSRWPHAASDSRGIRLQIDLALSNVGKPTIVGRRPTSLRRGYSANKITIDKSCRSEGCLVGARTAPWRLGMQYDAADAQSSAMLHFTFSSATFALSHRSIPRATHDCFLYGSDSIESLAPATRHTWQRPFWFSAT